jgi:hypothetical protein
VPTPAYAAWKGRCHSKINDHVTRNTSVENIEENKDDDGFLDDKGNFAPVDPRGDAACRILGFLYRAEPSFGARAESQGNG